MNFPAHNQKEWDRLFDLLFSDDERITDTEVDADLQRAGIDVRPTLRRVQEMIEQKKARTRLAQASDIRARMTERVRNVVGPTVEDIRSGARQFIERLFSGAEQGAYFHKLEKSATEEDLRSLMDDLTRLADLRQADKNDGSQTK